MARRDTGRGRHASNGAEPARTIGTGVEPASGPFLRDFGGTTTERWAVRLPLPPNRANGRGHWWQVETKRNRYYAACDAALLGRRPPDVPHVGIVWRASLGVASLYDADNLVSLLKWPLDWLVWRGWWEDDGPRIAWPEAWPTQEVARKHERHVTVTWTAGQDIDGATRQGTR